MMIKTYYWCKPIPMRKFDWCARRDDYEDGGLQGFGETEQSAIDDLLLLEAENDESDL